MARVYKTGRAKASTPYETYKYWYERYARNNEMHAPIITDIKEFENAYEQVKEAGIKNPAKAVAADFKEASELKVSVWASEFEKQEIPEHIFDAEFGEGAYKKYTNNGIVKKSFIKQNAKQFMNWADFYYGDDLDAILSP